MPRTVHKEEALELLAESRRALLESGLACVMCALVRPGREHPDFVAESERGVLVLDRFGSREGHLLVIAKRHVERFADLDWETYADLQRLAFRATAALDATLAPARTFVAVLGTSAELPMSFPHFHIHVLPVYETDERARPAEVFSWSSGVLVYDDAEAAALAARLKSALAV